MEHLLPQGITLEKGEDRWGPSGKELKVRGAVWIPVFFGNLRLEIKFQVIEGLLHKVVLGMILLLYVLWMLLRKNKFVRSYNSNGFRARRTVGEGGRKVYVVNTRKEGEIKQDYKQI